MHKRGLIKSGDSGTKSKIATKSLAYFRKEDSLESCDQRDGASASVVGQRTKDLTFELSTRSRAKTQRTFVLFVQKKPRILGVSNTKYHSLLYCNGYYNVSHTINVRKDILIHLCMYFINN